MNRRKFLKYAGTSAAVVGASALGLNYISQQSPSIVSPTASTTSTTRELTTTSSSLSSSLSSSTEALQLASLQGRLFFDYNGNGKQDGEEPAVAGAVVQLRDNAGKVIAETLTNSLGDYRLDDVRTGPYWLRLGVEYVSDKRFTYMCRSTDELTAVSQGYHVLLDRSQRADIGLMEGFLTSPFREGKSEVLPNGYVDLDPRLNYIRDWKGGDQTYDGHRGTDFIAQKGTEVLAASPGWVYFAWNEWPNKPIWGDQNDSWLNGNFVVLDHGNNVWSHYHHLDSITVQETLWRNLQFVKRGDVIGHCGYTGFRPDLVTRMTPDQVHLHFEISPTDPNNGNKYARDPFRDLYYGQHGDSPRSNPVSFWTKDNDPQYSVT